MDIFYILLIIGFILICIMSICCCYKCLKLCFNNEI